MSRIGKRPVELRSAKLVVGPDFFEVQGTKGKVRRVLPAAVKITVNGPVAQVSAAEELPVEDRSRMTGTVRSHLANAVKGVVDGYVKTLKLEGTGYRAELKGQVVTMALGLSHPAVYELPKEISAKIPPESKNTVLVVESADKDLLGQVCADLRSFRPPEPYKGKGVRIEGEIVRRKAGKAGKTGGGK